MPVPTYTLKKVLVSMFIVKSLALKKHIVFNENLVMVLSFYDDLALGLLNDFFLICSRDFYWSLLVAPHISVV